MKRPKISIVGAGHVGATTAQCCLAAELGDVVLVDICDHGDMARGKALDLAEASPVLGFDGEVTGTDDFEATASSDVVVVTAGAPRRPGMSRDELLEINTRIVTSVAEEIRHTSPHAVVIVVTNPLDAMTLRTQQVTGFATHRVVGQAGMLDTARFRSFLAIELGVSVEDISAMLLGGHGDTMVPLVSCTSVGGVPVSQLVSRERLDQIVQRTRDGGTEIVNLMKTSAYYAAGAATMRMVEAVMRDKRRLMPCCSYCDTEYGVGGYYVGVPTILGGDGVERIVEVELTAEEDAAFRRSIEAVKQLVERMGQIEPVGVSTD